jgi:hypothetical protein
MAGANYMGGKRLVGLLFPVILYHGYTEMQQKLDLRTAFKKVSSVENVWRFYLKASETSDIQIL